MYGMVIRKHLERTNRNLLVSNGTLLLLILIYAIMMSVITGQNQFFFRMGSLPSAPSNSGQEKPVDMSHPSAITLKDLASDSRLTHLKDRAVKLTDNKAFDLAFPVWNSTQRAADDKPGLPPNYHLSKAGNRLFVILPAGSQAGPVYTGVIRTLAKDDEDTVMTVLHSRNIQRVALMPFMLDCLSVRGRSGVVGTSDKSDSPDRPAGSPAPRIPMPNMFLLLLGAVPVWNIVKALQRMKDPQSHPLLKSLAKYGPPVDIARSIDFETAQGVTKIIPAQFTVSWLLVPTFFTLIVVPLDAIVWIYERVYITRGRSYAVCLHDRQGGYHEFTCAMFQVRKIIEYVTSARPWIVTGYSSQANLDFVNNRAQFIAQVDARRQQSMASPAGHPPYPTPLS